jgi:citrate synthase
MAMPHVHEGLRDVVAVRSAISAIVDDTLFYRGIGIDELAEYASFEEVVFLLWEGRLSLARELEALQQAIADSRSLPEPVERHLALLAPDARPMDVLRTAVSLLALADPETHDMAMAANRRKAVRLVARLPTVVAFLYHHAEGRRPPAPSRGLGAAASFLSLLHGREPDLVSAEAFNHALVLHADHELNASTFAARVAASTLADIYAATTAAVAALEGRLHGGANEQVMRMLETIGSVERVEPYVRERLARRERIMGFGHAVYRTADPRARFLKALARQVSERAGDDRWFRIAERVEEVVRREKGLFPNVDFYAAVLYRALGIPTRLFTPVFATSRIAGWTAHIMEQYQDNRLIRPRAAYVGPTGRHYVPVEERGA